MSVRITTMTRNIFLKCTITLVALLYLAPLAHSTESISILAQVESGTVYVGQPFTLQLTVNGAEAEQEPDVRLQDFKVEPQGSTNRSQSYQVSINGKVETTKTTSFIYQYLLTTAKTGVVTIPAIPVTIGGATYSTKPITLTVKEPEESDDFKLQVRLSREHCYVGEAITMTTTWLIRKDLQGFAFNLPIFSDPRFELLTRTPGPGNELVEIEVAGQKVIADKREVSYGGRQFIAISFSHTLIPQTPGKLRLPTGSLAINAFAGYSQPRQRQYGRDPFGMFDSGRRKRYSTVVIPANRPELEVMALPTKNRPANFSGMVGQYTIVTEATPTTVNVGDPINLTVSIAGTFVDNLGLPPLQAALPSQDFKSATDKPKATVKNGIKSFTTTIRASNDKVSTIPALSLPFFNPATKSYEIASSKAIALNVRPTRVVTALDAFGAQEKSAATAPGNALVSEKRQDICPNYEDIDSTISTENGNLLHLAILLLPPLLFGLFLFADYYQHDDSREQKHRRRLAFRHLRKRLRSCSADEFFDAWLDFLGDKLGQPSRSITRSDILARLSDHSEAQKLAGEIDDIFTQGEAALYGGMGHVLDKKQLLAVAKKIAEVL